MNNFYLGIVEDRISDPLKLGRVKVRVFGVHTESTTDIPTADLPWAIPLMPAGSASLSGIGDAVPQYIEGSTVFLFFQDGESKQQPIILGSLAGIPINKNPLSNMTEEVSSNIVAPKAVVLEASQGTLTDSSGQAVVDSSGTPVQTEVATEMTPPLDITEMVAKYGDNVTLVYETLLNFGIKDPYALIGILSNVAKECSFKITRESLNYTTTGRLKSTFPTYFGSMPESTIATYLSDERKVANLVYANRYGNGSTESGDGYNFRGGGFIQLTFKNNYRDVGSNIGLDLVSDPSQISDKKTAAQTTAQYFIGAYGGRGRLSFSSLEEALISITKKVNPGGFTRDYPKIVTNSKLCRIIDNTAIIDKQATEETSKPNNPENDVNPTATQEQINSGIASKNKPIGSGTGFKDPAGKYPLTSMLNEQDISRLARRNTVGTSIEIRNNKKINGIKNVAGTTFDEPAPAYNAQYPYNKVHATESGHTIEFDDTPGNERISQFHAAGTYTEIDKYGNTVNKIVGDNYSITERNGYIYIDGTARISVGSDVKLRIAGTMDIEIDGDLNYNVGGSVNWKIGGDSIQGIGGRNSIRSSGATDIDSSLINLNSGLALPNTPNARAGTTNDYPKLIPENFLGAETIAFDDADPETVIANEKIQIKSGMITQEEIDKGANTKPIEKDEAPVPAIEPVPSSCAMFENKEDIPDTTQISKYFTIGMLSSKAVVSHYKIAAQHGLTKAQIACNLKNLAENCLDIIKAKYPNMKVTSAFRGNSGSTSQHERGMAADMQFDGVSKADYYDIAVWIKSNVICDQLLLEYKTTGTRLPWIHISYNSQGCRSQVMTFMNNKKFASGLQKLEG